MAMNTAPDDRNASARSNRARRGRPNASATIYHSARYGERPARAARTTATGASDGLSTVLLALVTFGLWAGLMLEFATKAGQVTVI
jgi:hypothetical protein